MADEVGDLGDLYLKNMEVTKLLFVCQRDAKSRQLALEKVHEFLDSWLDGYGSPPQGGAWMESAGNGLGNRLSFVEEMVPDLLRLTLTCPFDDVRDRCRQMLEDIKVNFH
jgi:hypothetical protein